MGSEEAKDVLRLHDGASPGKRRTPSPLLRTLPQTIARLHEQGLKLRRLDDLPEVEGYGDRAG